MIQGNKSASEYQSLIGVVHYAYGEYVIYPRFNADLQLGQQLLQFL